MTSGPAQTFLRRYSKPRGAGDQTSGGRGKLLRTTRELTRIQILVRETLQNSWDAAVDGWIPAYGVHVRRVTPDTAQVMAERIFTGLGSELLELWESLQATDLHVLEIYDRGTTGLDGPISPDIAVKDGDPNNFNAFVFDIGSTKPLGRSGGTFGFGKTATFEVSRPHAVVYWTRCDRGDGVLEDRLIASALHKPYDVDGKRFTGAHWWGDPQSESIVPLCGPQATELAELLFETWFGEEETGTSILVIDPMVTLPEVDEAGQRVAVRSDLHASEIGRQVVDAMATSGWPKLVPYADGEAPMILDYIGPEGRTDIAGLVRERFAVMGHGLAAIRNMQQGPEWGPSWEKPDSILDEKLYPITLRPPRNLGWPYPLTGHAYFARVLRNMLPSDLEWQPVNQLCFMRSDAELVVWYEPVTDDDEGLFQWFGVFKPTDENDLHFAASEPSTHDAWNKNTPEDPTSVYVVEKTLAQVRRKAREFMNRYEAALVAEVRSARRVAQSLAFFVPQEPSNTLVGGAKGQGSSASRRGRMPSFEVTVGTPVIDAMGRWTIEFSLSGESGIEYDLYARVQAVTFEGGMDLEDDEVEVQWEIGHVVTAGRALRAESGSTGKVRLFSSVETTLSFDIHVSEVV